jgi:hypothetical protein
VLRKGADPSDMRPTVPDIGAGRKGSEKSSSYYEEMRQKRNKDKSRSAIEFPHQSIETGIDLPHNFRFYAVSTQVFVRGLCQSFRHFLYRSRISFRELLCLHRLSLRKIGPDSGSTRCSNKMVGGRVILDWWKSYIRFVSK